MEHAPHRFFEDVVVGEALPPVEQMPTPEAVEFWCRLSGQPTRNRFNDPEVARREGLPGPIVPGTLLMTYMSQLLTGWAADARLLKVEAIFRKSARPQIPVRVSGVVTDAAVVDGEGRVECDLAVGSLDGERFVTGHGVVALPRKPG